MKLLFDTHAFIWWDTEPQKLSQRAFTLCSDSANELFLSVVSIWEMAIKIQIGKLRFNKSLHEMIAEQQQANRLILLPVTVEHALAVESLPMIHKDPFDRLLLAQVQVEEIVFLSHDRQVANYPVAIEW